MIRTSVLVACSRCNRPAYCCKVPYGQKIHLSQFPEKYRRFDCPCLRQKVKLLNQNLKFTPSKPCSKPAQATAAPGLHDQHLTIDAEAALTQVPTFDCHSRLLSPAQQRVRGHRAGPHKVGTGWVNFGSASTREQDRYADHRLCRYRPPSAAAYVG